MKPNARIAKIGEKSIIAIGGKIFLNNFKYGSQISCKNFITNVSLVLGNQLEKIYTISDNS